MTAVDDTLDRIYRRLGWRIVIAYQAVSYLGALGIDVGASVVLGRVTELSFGETTQLIGLVAAAIAVAAASSTFAILRTARPLIDWLDSPHEAGSAEAAWRLGLRLPQVATKWNSVFVLLIMPIVIGVATDIASLDPAGAIMISIAYLCSTAVLVAGILPTGNLAVRPILRDVAESLPNQPLPDGGITLRARLLLVLPALLVFALVGGVGLGLPPGDDLGGALPELLIGIAIATALAVPVALIFTYSATQPLDDLLRATERLKGGDFTTRVPELAADEHGLLAHSFNEAMQGLAERQVLARENARLLDEVRASRVRIVAASDAERRRIERNIHDGAQQQLVALALDLSMIKDEAESERLRSMAAAANDSLAGALEELRELARGLHPSILATDGLAPALKQLAARSPVPVVLQVPRDRFPGQVEATAYYVASEALANVAKYAKATRAEVTVQPSDGALSIEIADDGIGGARQENGSGLAGLADRIAALEGTIKLESPPNKGTRISVRLPLGHDNGSADT